MHLNNFSSMSAQELKNEADTYFKNNDLGNAQLLYQRSLANDPDPKLKIEILNNLAASNIFNNNFDQALEQLTEARKLSEELVLRSTNPDEIEIVQGKVISNIGFVFLIKGQELYSSDSYELAEHLVKNDSEASNLIRSAIDAANRNEPLGSSGDPRIIIITDPDPKNK